MKEDPLFYLEAMSRILTVHHLNVGTSFSSSDPSYLSSCKSFEFPALRGQLWDCSQSSRCVLWLSFPCLEQALLKANVYVCGTDSISNLRDLLLGLSVSKLTTGLFISSLAGLTFAFALITFVEDYGRRRIGFSPIRMFRAFLTDWLEADNHHLESYLNELGVATQNLMQPPSYSAEKILTASKVYC